ncbi:MAG: hypothetical protein M1508_00850 [Nitrospirae bacterium]|nr:hypothetical protein [Nitrospirota bacterium]MCL5421445.1 hypothetical protein [Nitrospirota bacterium]
MKKPYKKPEIKKVQLKPEEAVLTACKTRPQGCPRPWEPGGRTGGS